MNNRIGIWITTMLFASSLAGCGFLPNSSSSAPSPVNTASEATENDAQPTAPTSKSLSIPPPSVLPPSYGDRPPEPGETQTQTLPNGLPSLQPKGVNVDALFADTLKDDNQRFTRLENAVQDIRSELEAFKPAIVRLVAVESDIQDLIKQLDVLLKSEPAPQPVAQAPTQPPTPLAPVPTATAQVSPAPASVQTSAPAPRPTVNGPPSVSALRVGTHSDKVRIVMDLSKKSSYTAELDNQENLLVIELPEARWNAARNKTFSSKGKLLQSYSVEDINNGQGSRIVMVLKKGTQILKRQALPPGLNPNYRIFLDLQP